MADNKDDQFVMPEKDDFKSGVPLEDQEQKKIATDLNPEGFNQRLKQSQEKTPGTETARTPGSIGTTPRHRGGGLGIKFKLSASLGILTLIIVVLGGFSLFTIVELNALSDNISQRYSRLARTTEEIKATVYKISESEQLFRITEEQLAIDANNRLVARLREQVKDAVELGKAIAEETGKATDKRITDIYGVIDTYEQTFADQVRQVHKARTGVDDNAARIKESREKLAGRTMENTRAVNGLAEDYLAEIAGTAEAKKAGLDLDTVSTLFKLNTAAAGIEVLAEKYLRTNDEVMFETAVKQVEKTARIILQLRRETTNNAIRSKLEEVTESLDIYTGMLRQVQRANQQFDTHQIAADEKVSRQKTDLSRIAADLIQNATLLSDGAWEMVQEESLGQKTLGDKNQRLLLILAASGILIGLLVLWLVPRPIIATISQLLENVQQVAAGELGQVITTGSNDELGQLADGVEKMRNSLVALVDRIQKASAQISTTVNEIQAASSEQASSANEQNAVISQFAASLREISQTGKELAGSAREIAESTREITTHVNDTSTRSGRLMESMDTIGTTTVQTSERIKSLNDQMDNIVDAVSTIASVADQTTLLSLNAAIEANKAGETGKGFSVVATEIRRLSDRSIDSAESIGGLVREIQRSAESSVVSMDKSSSEIREGNRLANESSEAMTHVNASMNRIEDQSGTMSDSMLQQSKASDDAEKTVTQILEASRLTTQATNQTSAAAYELAGMARQLADAVAAFKL